MISQRMVSSSNRATEFSQEPSALADVASNTPANNPIYNQFLNDLHTGAVILQFTDRDSLRSARIVGLNDALTDFAGVPAESLRGIALSGFPRLLETRIPNHCIEALNSGSPADLGEISVADQRTGQRVFSVRVFPLSPDSVGITFENITDRRTLEQAIRESDKGYQLLVESIDKYAAYQLDCAGLVTTWNESAERLYGYRPEEIIGRHYSLFFPAAEARSQNPARRLQEAAARGQCEDNGWRVRKDGSSIWANVVITALREPEGTLRGFVNVTRDMTEQRQNVESLNREIETLKSRARQWTVDLMMVNDELRAEVEERRRAEEQLASSRDQLRALAARLQNSREEERIRIAREIHDELGQACAALKMDLAFLARKTPMKQKRIHLRLESAIGLVDEVIQSTRRIASELWPKILEDLGLTAALEWQAQEFESRTQIQCHIALPDDALKLDMDRSTAIFRIFQESLTNVARHSHASRVEAKLWQDGSSLVFHVHDDGQGFDPRQTRARRSLGLVGMQERVNLLNGEFEVESSPGKGATVKMQIPLPSPSQKEQRLD